MCLATVFKESDHTVLMRNASRIEVDGDKVIIEDIIGDRTTVIGRIKWVDLTGSEVCLVCE
ncbi:MAG: CooT family nickel-binding protein [Eubacteriales bacterium]|nr:CooT family nickel-binding protein [Eubacteriales bacterium]